MSAPVRVAERLRAAPDGAVPLVHRGPHALYVEIGGWCLGLVDSLAAAVPCALRAATTSLPAVHRAEVRGGVLHLDERQVRPGRYVAVDAPTIRVRSRRPAPLSADEVAALVGAGEGLTPYGDDVLCGWLAAHRAARVPTPEVDVAVRAALHRTTLLSATLLDCALHGEVVPEFAAWLQGLGTAEEPAHAARLAAVGHTSGIGMLRGAHRALSGLGLAIGAAA